MLSVVVEFNKRPPLSPKVDFLDLFTGVGDRRVPESLLFTEGPIERQERHTYFEWSGPLTNVCKPSSKEGISLHLFFGLFSREREGFKRLTERGPGGLRGIGTRKHVDHNCSPINVPGHKCAPRGLSDRRSIDTPPFNVSSKVTERECRLYLKRLSLTTY